MANMCASGKGRGTRKVERLIGFRIIEDLEKLVGRNISIEKTLGVKSVMSIEEEQKLRFLQEIAFAQQLHPPPAASLLDIYYGLNTKPVDTFEDPALPTMCCLHCKQDQHCSCPLPQKCSSSHEFFFCSCFDKSDKHKKKFFK